MSDLDFSGKTALIVGGSSGIGNGIAQAFRKRGADVHVWGTRASAADYADEAGSDLTGLGYACVDVGERAAIEATQPSFGKLDILVLSQGQVLYKRAEFEPAGWDRVMAVNLDSLLFIANKFRPMLAETKGSLITISSVSGFWSNRGNPAYAASKAGAISLTKTLGEAWAREGIRVNGIAPGLVETKMTAVTTQDPKRMETILSSIPMRRPGTPEELAGAALFLASPLAAYMCGHTIVVDGGLSIMGR
ncbi:MAG: SDR family NAD(P)-dependent oxidoreductase [Hyphomonadaceae bacterium]